LKHSWPWKVKLYWDPWRNTPIIKPRQEEIDLLYQLKLSEPGDLRPAFRGDYEKLKNAIIYEFGSVELYQRFFEGKFTLLNKVPHWDIMYEVVSSGNVVGQLYYDPFMEKWRFRLTFQGAYIALNEGLVDYVRTQPPIYTGKEVESSTSTSSRQVVVVDEKNNIRGVASVEGSRVVVSKVFHERFLPVETSNNNPSIEDVLKYNIEGLTQLEEKSIKYLNRLRKRYSGLSAVVSYSGGKDSLVALDLTYRALGDLEVVFNDTGLELPETLRNVEEVANHYGTKLHIATAGDIFWRAVEVFGPPGKDYRWCCKVAKLVPIARLTKTKWPGGALNIVGQRAYESLDRAKSPLVWRNKWIPHMVSTTPIQYWSQLATWLYIYRYKLPYNKLYEEGFDRLGCYLCPSCALAEYSEVKRIYPELWEKWDSVLEKWRVRLGQPREWVKYGLWRWLTPATAKNRITHHLENYTVDWRKEYSLRLQSSTAKLTPISINKYGEEIVAEFNEQVIPSDKRELYIKNATALGFKINSEDPLVVSRKGVHSFLGNSIRVKPAGDKQVLEELVDLLKIAYRLRACVYCGACVLWTRRGSVVLTHSGPQPLVELSDKERVVYVEVCPISDQLVEKIVVSLVTGDYKSFKRKTRARPMG